MTRSRPAAVTITLLAALIMPAVSSGCRSDGSHLEADRHRKEALGSQAEIPVHLPVTPDGRARYAGTNACTGCHPQQAEQLASRHARTLTKVDVANQSERFRAPSQVRDPQSGILYHASVHDGACVLEAKTKEGTLRARAEYALGSGNRGITYLGRAGDQRVELRLSYYAPERRWHFTPGQEGAVQPGTTPVGRRVASGTAIRCFQCHTSAVVQNEGEVMPEQSIFGVSCEACHGPGAEHIAAVQRKDRDLRMARLATLRARVSTELCGQCHRSPGSDDPTQLPDIRQLPRFQAAALVRSQCFIKSEGRLSCVTCHNPHQDADLTTRAEYNRQCRSCHAPATSAHVACPRQPAGDCVSCHMPVQAVNMPTAPKFRTHWIKVWEQRSAAAARGTARRKTP